MTICHSWNSRVIIQSHKKRPWRATIQVRLVLRVPSGHSSFMHAYAILIDGGFVKRKLGTQDVPMSAARLNLFVQALCTCDELRGLRLHRVYFYDAAPLSEVVKKPLAGGQINFRENATAKRNSKLHQELARLRYFALRMGELDFRGWSLDPKKLDTSTTSIAVSADDLRPNITQKGVDMRIGMDIASLTLKKLVQVIVLVTGDSDFIPAMKFARREGTQLFLAPIGHRIKDAMHEHADIVLDVQ